MPKRNKQERIRAFTSLCLAGLITLTIVSIFVMGWLAPGMLLGYLIWGQ